MQGNFGRHCANEQKDFNKFKNQKAKITRCLMEKCEYYSCYKTNKKMKLMMMKDEKEPQTTKG